MKQIYIKELMIEAGRSCQLTCDHCIRGESQKKRLNVDKFEDFIVKSNIKSIGLLMFTGGEPSLFAKEIEGVIDVLVKYSIDVGSWWISSNGLYHRKTYSFLRACARLHNFCTDNDMSGIQISTGDFHQNSSSLHFWREFQDEYNWDYPVRGNLIFDSGVSKITNQQINLNFSEYTTSNRWLFNDGFALENGLVAEKEAFEPWESNSSFEISSYNGFIDFVGEEPIYFSAIGGIGIGCNFSYNRFDNELKVCNVEDFNNADEFIDQFVKFAEKHDAEWEINLSEEAVA